MSSKGNKTDRPIVAWEAQTLRVTAFLVDREVPPSTPWWDDFIGEPPESEKSRPREGIYRQTGTFENGILNLNRAPGRIDWFYSNKPSEDEGDIATLGSLTSAQSEFCTLINQWIPVCPPISRLAFGAVLILPVANRKEGYQTLQELLPAVKLDIENSADFFYQINRPRKSTTSSSDLEINRLSKWFVQQHMIIGIEIGSRSASVTQHKIPENQTTVCKLELDVNTSPEFARDLDPKERPALFQELVDLSSEIAREGDNP